MFGRGDFERLADQLAGIRGRFLLSINDTPGARAVFRRFPMRAVETTWSISAKVATKRADELIVGTALLG